MRHASRALLAGGLGLAVSFLVACGGGSGLLSSDQASTLNSQLDQVSSAVGSGNCAAASSAVSDFSNMISNLPTGVNQTLRDNLSQDASRLGQLAAADCQNATTTTSTTTTSTSSTPTSTTSSSTTTPATITSASATSTATSTATTSADTGTSTTGTSGGAGLGGNGGGSGGRGTGGAGAGGNGQ